DVEGEIRLATAYLGPDGSCHRLGPLGVHVRCGQDLYALSDGPVPDVAPDRRANADLNHTRGIDQTLLDGVIEEGAMSVLLPEGVGPGVHMGIEMHESKRALSFRYRAQQGKRDRMVAAEGDQMPAFRGLGLDELEAAQRITQRDLEIADVGEGLGGRIAPIQ